jgi:hypothetical protein
MESDLKVQTCTINVQYVKYCARVILSRITCRYIEADKPIVGTKQTAVFRDVKGLYVASIFKIDKL